MNWFLYTAAAAALIYLVRRLWIRLRLSRAKHPSARGHAKMSRRLARLIPFYEYGEDTFFRCDGAPDEIAARRKAAFDALGRSLRERSPKSIQMADELEGTISDIRFTNAYRVPFQFRNHVRKILKLGAFVEESDGPRVRDLDGNWYYDLSGSYGVNLFGNDFYKGCLDAGIERVRDLGIVLGGYHPVVAENATKLRDISGLDEVSFHMSGTEAVMQAVRLARYHTRRSHLVRFCGAYHGWWDGVQPGVGNQRVTNDVYTLKDMSEDTLKVLRTRKDIACVLVNPVQALHPNGNPPGDALLIASDRSASFDREAYTAWLHELKKVCAERSIVLIFDEVFVGFRLARRGAQEYFNVKADMVTYGKSLGGGLPVGVVCGRADLMKRFRDDRPTDVCYARGTFNSHPYVMGAMHEFLRRLDDPESAFDYALWDSRWNDRTRTFNRRLEERQLPVRIANMSSIWTVLYTAPSRYNWMFQYYLRSHGLALSWIGTGRCIFSHNLGDGDFGEITDRFVAAAEAMGADGWWWGGSGLDNKAMKRQVLREVLRAKFGRR